MSDFRVIAILSAYNEGDVIAHAVRHLVEQGILVYVIDHWSTDDTAEQVRRGAERGVVGMERFPGSGPLDESRLSWEAILRRKEALSRALDAEWFIHHDADEFRESPWGHLSLRDAIQVVDGLGYNAIDFELLNFWPTHDDFQPGADVREAFTFYERGGSWDKVQIKCWKNLGIPVDLATSGGHDAAFADRRVCPLRFILRHYPIRGQAHGERKVLIERRQRFGSERPRGWHVQYDGIEKGHSFLRDEATLTRYDATAVRFELILRHRVVEEMEAAAERAAAALTDLQRRVEGLTVELAERQVRIADLSASLARCTEELAEARQGSLENDRRRAELRAVYASRSWRWMAPLRALQRVLLRLRRRT